MTQFTVKELNDIISDLLINTFNNIDEVTDANVGGVMRTMLEAIAVEIELLYQQLQNIYDGTRIDTSTSTDLDQLGALVGVTRKQGTESEGYVTFQRTTTATSDFTIAQNSVVTTQPNTGEEQLRFLVATNTTFSSSVTNELNEFVNGIYEYPLGERLIDSIQSLTATVLTVPGVALTEGVDFTIESVSGVIEIDTENLVTVDDCEVADWTESADATAEVLDPTDYRQGDNSLDLGKSGIASDTASYEKVLGAIVDGSDANMHLWVKIEDSTALGKIYSIDITYGSGGDATNSYSYSVRNTYLVEGWQRIDIDRTSSGLSQAGFPSISAINFLKIDIVTNNSSDTLASGDVKMDFWFFAPQNDYTGDLVRFTTTGTLPDDMTNFVVSYKPLSKEVLCQSEAVGIKYNVSPGKIVYKVSSIPNIDTVYNYEIMGGGSDVEIDDTYRQRIKDSSLAGAATVAALEQAVLAVEGVTSVTVDDLPQKSASAEVHTYSTSTTNYKLDFEVALDDGTLTITGTVSATPGHTFVKNTDYILNADNEIEWLTAGTKPDDVTLFYADYNYDWLGHVEIFVSGVEAPLPPAVVADVNTAVEDTRAAGVVVLVLEPTIVSIDVTATVAVIGGYTSAEVISDAISAVRAYLNGLAVGDDVFRAEITRVIQETPGVLNSSVSVPVSDTTINIDQVAKAGTVVITL